MGILKFYDREILFLEICVWVRKVEIEVVCEILRVYCNFGSFRR